MYFALHILAVERFAFSITRCCGTTSNTTPCGLRAAHQAVYIVEDTTPPCHAIALYLQHLYLVVSSSALTLMQQGYLFRRIHQGVYLPAMPDPPTMFLATNISYRESETL